MNKTLVGLRAESALLQQMQQPFLRRRIIVAPKAGGTGLTGEFLNQSLEGNSSSRRITSQAKQMKKCKNPIDNSHLG